MRRWFHAAAVLVAVALGTSCITPKEYLCDESVGHLKECCPDFDAKTLNCDEDNFSFTNGKFSPDLGRAAATCVLDSSCDEIRARDVCRKLAVRTQSGQTTNVQEIVCAR